MGDDFTFKIDVGSSGGGGGGANNGAAETLAKAMDRLSSEMHGFKEAANNFSKATANYQKAKNALTPEQKTIRSQTSATQAEARKAKFAYLNNPATQNNAIMLENVKVQRSLIQKESAKQKIDYLSSSAYRENVKAARADYITKHNTRKEMLRLNQADRGNRQQQFLEKHEKNLALFQEKNIPHLLKNTQIEYLQKQAVEAGNRGDIKTQNNLNNKIADAVKTGFRDGIKATPMRDMIGAIAGSAGVNAVAGSYIRNQGLNLQMAQAGMINPLTNGYNYGGQAGTILSASMQHNINTMSGIATAVGGVAGGLIGGLPGAGIGAGIGAIGSSLLGANTNMKAQAQAQAITEYMNQTMNTGSLKNTNAAAYNRLNQLNGFSPNSTSSQLNARLPFQKEAAIGAARYNNNANLESITNYAIAAQLPASQVRGLAAASTQLGLSNAQFGGAVNLANTYGVDATDIMNRAVLFRQGGMGTNAALQSSAQSFSSTQGFQNFQLGGMQGGYLDRTQKTLLAKYALGLDYNKILNPKKYPSEMKKLADVRAKASSSFGENADMFSQAALDQLGLTQSTTELSPAEIRKMQVTSGMPTPLQEKEIAFTNKTRQEALGANFDSDKATEQVRGLVNEMSGTTIKFVELSNAMDGFIDRVNKVFTNPNAQAPAVAAYKRLQTGSTESSIGNK